MKNQSKIVVLNRIARIRRIAQSDTQKIRMKLLKNLEEIFNLASDIARGEIKYQMVDGQPVKITLKQREKWARVAAYVAQIINSLAKGFDERKIDIMLEEAERLIREAGSLAEEEDKGNTGAAEAARTRT
jgi:hypothetical protein